MYDFQKANMWKRISAALCDLILLCVVVVGVAFLLSTVLGYDGYLARLEDINNSYEVEYGVDLDVSALEYEGMTADQQTQYQAAMDAFATDSDANYVYGMIVNLTFIIITFSILLGYVLLEFVVPLCLGNGQTFGKKVFGIAIMREDGVKLTPLLLFTRTVLGKYTVETMVPVFIILLISLGLMGIFGTVAIIALLIVQIAMVAATKARTPIHDKIAHTVTVDFASQMIFDSPEALLEYKKRIHAESVESEKY